MRHQSGHSLAENYPGAILDEPFKKIILSPFYRDVEKQKFLFDLMELAIEHKLGMENGDFAMFLPGGSRRIEALERLKGLLATFGLDEEHHARLQSLIQAETALRQNNSDEDSRIEL